ncbi:uncharacterized protein DDB_G0279899-like [Ostrea edulis]|uniref:uncharacterized protein DDB_G0279899-like n=1 Tax=Ostrea edulis TaxID=37623 RepID=UPI0024AEBF05|nr:uncharacterized protein DDB_G0279899-like [Ostrea edulis]
MAEGGVGLETVLCELCEDEPAQFFCRTCSGNLCVNCKVEHKSRKIFYRHDVVKMTLTRKMEKDGYGYCYVHPESRYELCCHGCEVPVCTKCISGVHNGHKVTDISSIYLEARSKISENLNEIEASLIPKHTEKLGDLDNVLSDVNRQSRDLEQTVARQSQELIDIVQSVEKEFIKKICVEKESHIKEILGRKAEVKDHISTLQNFQDSLIQERDSQSMTDLILCSKNHSDIPHKNKVFGTLSFQKAFFTTRGSFHEEVRNMFGIYFPSVIFVQQGKKQIMTKPKEMNKFKSPVTAPVGLVFCRLNVDLAWIRGISPKIKKIDGKGNSLATITTHTDVGRPSGLIELENGSVLYSDLENKKIIKVSKDSQEVELDLTWYPMGLCISRTGHILVCVASLSYKHTGTSDVGKILRINTEGDILQEIEKNGEGESLYTRPICISENINQNICVSDYFKRAVIVVERSGLFRFAYDGGDIYKSTFSPCELDNDSVGNIAVSDQCNNSVHLLDIDGSLIKYLLTEKDGIFEPRGLKIDNEDRLWITEISTEYVKIFRYME